MYEIKSKLDLRSSNLELRKKFESRILRTDESFNDYCHDKLILASHVALKESEITDCIIDGIPDPRLRDQAQMHSFDSPATLSRAFQNITLRSDAKHRSKRNSERTNRDTRNSKAPADEDYSQ